MAVVTFSAKRARRFRCGNASAEYRSLKRAAHRMVRRKVREILKGYNGEDISIVIPPVVTSWAVI